MGINETSTEEKSDLYILAVKALGALCRDLEIPIDMAEFLISWLTTEDILCILIWAEPLYGTKELTRARLLRTLNEYVIKRATPIHGSESQETDTI